MECEKYKMLTVLLLIPCVIFSSNSLSHMTVLPSTMQNIILWINLLAFCDNYIDNYIACNIKQYSLVT